jgi:hypothetical protein
VYYIDRRWNISWKILLMTNHITSS